MKYIFALLLLAGLAGAQNKLYVAPPSATPPGNDANNCAQATPCATITRASKILTLGTPATFATTGTYTSFPNIATVVHVAPGTYNECVVTQAVTGYTVHNGTASQKILYVSDTQYGAHIVCNNGSNGVIWQNGTGGGANGAFVIQYGFDISGDSCWGIRNDAPFGEHYGNKVHDVSHGGGSLCSNGGAGISDNQTGNASPNNSHDSITEGNLIDNIGTATAGSCPNVHGVYIASERDIVRNNIISRSCGWGIQYFHFTNIGVCTNNVIINNRNGGIVVTASDGGESANNYTCSNNIVAHNGGNEFGIEERYGNASGASSIYRNNLYWGNSPTAGCSNGIANCPYNDSYGVRDNTGSANTGSDSSTFVNYTGNALTGDYHLKANIAGSTSAASGGMANPVPTRDLAGATRNATPSVGAFEFAVVSGSPHGNVQAPNPPVFPSQNIGTTGNLVTVTFVNDGTASATMGASSTSGTNAVDFPFGGSGTCAIGLVVPVGNTCTYTFRFAPLTGATGTRTATFTILSNSTNSPQTVSLSGLATKPDALLAPPTVSNVDDIAPDIGVLSCPEPGVIPTCTGQCWRWKHDTGTAGTSCGNSSRVASPSQDGQSRRFDISWTANGGERFSIPLTTNLDSVSTNYTYDAQVYVADMTHINQLEFDINQVLPSGDTLIFGTQANFAAGFWDYTTNNNNPLGTSAWIHSSIVASKTDWTSAAWHHLTIRYSRSGNTVTYQSISLDGNLQAFTGAVVDSNFTLGWTPIGLNLPNFQINGDNTANSTSAYLDQFSISGSVVPFATTTVNTTSPQVTATLFNSGTGPMTIPAGAFAVTGPFTVAADTCPRSPATLAAGQICNIPLTFSPLTAGPLSGTLTVTDDAASGTTQVLTLAGTGQALALPGNGVLINGGIILTGGVAFNPQ